MNNTIGAEVSDVGDPLDFWDELVGIFGAANTGGGNGNEITAEFFLGGSKFTLKFYPNSTTPPHCPTISIKKGNSFEFKIRFCD